MNLSQCQPRAHVDPLRAVSLIEDALCPCSLAKFLNMRSRETGNTPLQRILRAYSIHKPPELRGLLKKIIAACRLSLDVHSTNKRGQTILHVLTDQESYNHLPDGPCQTGVSSDSEEDEQTKLMKQRNAHKRFYRNRGRVLSEAVLEIALRKGADVHAPDNEGQPLAGLLVSLQW